MRSNQSKSSCPVINAVNTVRETVSSPPKLKAAATSLAYEGCTSYIASTLKEAAISTATANATLPRSAYIKPQQEKELTEATRQIAKATVNTALYGAQRLLSSTPTNSQGSAASGGNETRPSSSCVIL